MVGRISDSELHEMRIRKLQNDISDSARLGIPVKFMHLSALTPTSREHHVERHGELFTGQEMLDWWAEGDNRVRCRCACTPVLLDNQGMPMTPDLMAKAKMDLKALKASWSHGS
ncbi:Uncharacterized protein ALO64_02673 [Pseudomonas meliae]|uniref:Phage head morphogenesis domain-containing protein n=2 Tax=Pseudomonas meliae TaxID=86176 RepID=A0A0P9V9Z4_9PSED|nr:Uncharacterized protein ALO64_02673 [Pseudomonas meliae]